MSISVLIVLRKRHAQTRVYDTKHNGVGQHLYQVGLTRWQAQQDARRQEHEEDNGDNDVQIHLFVYTHLKISRNNIIT